MTDQTSFADIVKARREALSMTQAVLAGAAGLTERTVQRVERGESPSRETVMALCSVLSIAQTTAHAALMQSPPTRSSEVDATRFEGHVHTALPPAHGPVAEGERSLAIAKLVRSGNRFETITGPDLTAMAHAYVPEQELENLGLGWASGECEERVIDMARLRIDNHPLRRSIQWMVDRVGGLITGVLIVSLHACLTVTLAHWFLKDVQIAPLISIAFFCAGPTALAAFLMPTKIDQAHEWLSRHWVVGIASDRVVVSKTHTNDLAVVEAGQVVRCWVSTNGRHLSWNYTTFDGQVHRLDYIPDVSQVRAALERFERSVGELATTPAGLTPIAA